MDNNDKLIEDHEYDGIRELNNPLPGWWLATFYITIVFAVVYYIYYEFAGGPSLDEELSSELSIIETVQQQAEESIEIKSEENFLALLENEDAMEKAKAEFVTKCTACHGAQGQGIIGPNLTDEYWIHGDGRIPSIVKTINEGVVEKGMPPWKGVIAPDLVEQVAVYVYSIRGTDPPGAKPPQGEKVSE
jgi:cytochrome c oxidase cbb3-type subunit III